MGKSRSGRDRKLGVYGSALDIVALFAFGDIAERYIAKTKFDEKILMSGLPVLPVQYVSRMIMLTVLVAVYAFCFIAMILGWYGISMTSIVVCGIVGVVPLITFFYHILVVHSKISERRSCIDAELPLFASYITVLMRSGLSIEEIVRKVAEMKVLKCSSEEARRILSVMYTRGVDVLTAMEFVARHHPNPDFREFILGFITTLRTQTAPESYLANATFQIISKFEKKVEDAVKKAGLVALALVAMSFGILSTNMLALFSSTFSMPAGMYWLMSYVIMPLVITVMILVIDKMLPRLPTRIPEVYAYFVSFLPAGIGVSLIFYMALGNIVPEETLQSWMIAISLAIPSLAGWFAYRRIAKEESNLLDGFVAFLRDVAGGRRTGLPLEHVIMNLPPVYGQFNRYLQLLKQGIALGYPPATMFIKVFSRVRTATVRVIARMLGDILTLGGATPEVLSVMEEFMTKIRDALDRLRRELKTESLIPYMVVGLNATVIIIAASMMAKLATTSSNVLSMGGLAISPGLFKYTLTAMCGGLTITSFIMGLLVGLMRRQSMMAGLLHSAIMSLMTPIASTVGLLLSKLLP